MTTWVVLCLVQRGFSQGGCCAVWQVRLRDHSPAFVIGAVGGHRAIQLFIRNWDTPQRKRWRAARKHLLQRTDARNNNEVLQLGSINGEDLPPLTCVLLCHCFASSQDQPSPACQGPCSTSSSPFGSCKGLALLLTRCGPGYFATSSVFSESLALSESEGCGNFFLMGRKITAAPQAFC